MVGVAALAVVSAFYPGGPVIETVDQGNFPDAIAAMSANAGLAHVTTLIMVVAVLLESYGLLSLFRVSRQRGSLADSILVFGLVTTLFCLAVFLLELGMRHMVVHVTQHGVGPGTEAQLQDLALAVHTGMGGLHFAFLSLYPFGSIFLGIGLAARFRAMNVYKAALYGMVITGLIGVFNLVIVQHMHDLELGLIAVISNSVLSISCIWLFIIGWGIYRGRSELVP